MTGVSSVRPKDVCTIRWTNLELTGCGALMRFLSYYNFIVWFPCDSIKDGLNDSFRQHAPILVTFTKPNV